MKKSPLAVALIARMKGKEKPDMMDEDEDMGSAEGGSVDSEAKEVAAEEVMDAFKSRDVAALSAALTSFIDACGYGEE